MDKFYSEMIQQLLSNGAIRRDMSVLVVCGEELDASVFSLHGFPQVTVTNLDSRHDGSWTTGAAWDRQDAEALSYPDNSFDLVAVHLGLHHCRMPHKALCEMYRVARHGILLIEPCENRLVKIGRKLGIGQEYEVHAVAFHQLKAGGVNNTPIPNYVYRWTVNEIRQTIAAFAPEFRHTIQCKRNLVVHWKDLRNKKNKTRYLLMLGLFPVLKGLSCIFPGVANNLGVYIGKPSSEALHPWIQSIDNQLTLNKKWFNDQFVVTQ
ncbi:MAG: class I SAM-dependent methyltransferase [Kiritimatiellales bacterium]|jgi:SAM-dependent methyltransferase|nr:class I SAM-dependent methyltransferase [Kiritimatiellales bacterium]